MALSGGRCLPVRCNAGLARLGVTELSESQQLAQASVNFPTVTNVMYDNLLPRAVHAVNDPIIADSEPIQTFGPLQFESLPGKRMLLEHFDSLEDPGYKFSGKVCQILFHGRLERDLKGGHSSSSVA